MRMTTVVNHPRTNRISSSSIQNMLPLLPLLQAIAISTLMMIMMMIDHTRNISMVVEGRAILGVDMGSLYMKVALVQSGHPIEIVTNLHSKRKTEQMILFDAAQRGYGADAAALLQRKAHLTPTAMSIMLGRTDEHPMVQVRSWCVFWCCCSGGGGCCSCFVA